VSADVAAGPEPQRARLALPADVERALREYYTCEFTTINRAGQPVTWPSIHYYDAAAGRIVIAVSIAFPVKAYNARRNPHVSLLYSDPTGARAAGLPAVLVQGDAAVAEVLEYTPDIIGLFSATLRRQPDAGRFFANRVVRGLFDWYLAQRIALRVEPRRICVWPERDFRRAPRIIEAGHVE
jgi:hypothetical protein